MLSKIQKPTWMVLLKEEASPLLLRSCRNRYLLLYYALVPAIETSISKFQPSYMSEHRLIKHPSRTQPVNHRTTTITGTMHDDN